MRKLHRSMLVAAVLAALASVHVAEGKQFPMEVHGVAETSEERVLYGDDVYVDQTGKTEHVVWTNDGTIDVPCGADIEGFSSFVGARFIGNEQNLDECCEIPLLEGGFAIVYEKLMSVRCDQFQRGVQGVTLNVAGREESHGSYGSGSKGSYSGYRQRQRRTQSSNNSTAVSPVPDGSSFFNTAGECRGCPVRSGSFSLFNDGFRRRALENDEKDRRRKLGGVHPHPRPHPHHHDEDDHHQDSEDGVPNMPPDHQDSEDGVPNLPPELSGATCTCPAGAVDVIASYHSTRLDLRPDAPTIEEFRRAFNDYIDMLVRGGFMASIKGIAKLDEFNSPPL